MKMHQLGNESNNSFHNTNMNNQTILVKKYLYLRRLIYLTGAIFISGCANQPLIRDFVATKSACCSSMAQFNFRSIPLGQDFNLSITPAEPTFSFSDRLVHFVPLKVPDNFIATAIQVKSFLSTDYLPKATAVFPDFIYLDANFKIVGKAVVTDMQSAGNFWGSAISSRAQVPPKTLYIVVVAGDGSGGFPTINAGSGRPYSIPAAALGDISLRLFGE